MLYEAMERQIKVVGYIKTAWSKLVMFDMFVPLSNTDAMHSVLVVKYIIWIALEYSKEHFSCLNRL